MNNKSAIRGIHLSAALSALLASFTVDASGLEDGHIWLIAQQQPDGSWGSKNIDFVYTQEAVAALVKMQRYGVAYYRGIAWLENHGPSNHDALARRTRALAGRAGSVSSATYIRMLEEAVDSIAAQGSGWGLGSSLSPSPYDTALVLQALANTQPPADVMAHIEYLKSVRLPASGWEAVPGAGLDIATTAQVIRALDRFRTQDVALNSMLAEASSALLNAVDAGSSISDKSLALIAVLLEAPDSPFIPQWRSELLSAQLANGSWQNEVLPTALALHALASSSDDHFPSVSDPVFIPDPNLRAAINEVLGQNRGDAVSRGQLAQLTTLDLSYRGISDLTGLEYAVNLVSLDLAGNTIGSLAAVADLASLEILVVAGNPLSFWEDFDGDGFSDASEQQLGFDPLAMDSDGDGITDGDDPYPGYAGIPVDNTAPVTAADSASTLNTDAVTIPVLANDSDVDQDILTVIDLYAPAHGVVAIVDSGTAAEYTPSSSYHGPDAFSYRVHDGRGGFAKAEVDIEVIRPNVGPQANNDEVSTRRNLGVIVAVLENDADADNDVLVVSGVTQPANGQVAVLPDGVSLEYVPSPGFTGVDTFDYSISDGFGGTATGTVIVDVRSSFLLKILPSIL